MIRIITLALSFFLLSEHALASEKLQSINSIWINAASDYVMPLDGAKSYAGAPSMEMLSFLWGSESRSLPEDHPAHSVLEALLPQAGGVASQGLESVPTTPESVEKLVTERSELQLPSPSGQEAHGETGLPRQIGDLLMKSLSGFMAKPSSPPLPDESK